MQITNEWTELASKLKYRNQLFINGKFVDSLSGKSFDAISPIDQRKLTSISAAQTEDVDAAVKAAKSAFDSGIWRNQNPRKLSFGRFMTPLWRAIIAKNG